MEKEQCAIIGLLLFLAVLSGIGLFTIIESSTEEPVKIEVGIGKMLMDAHNNGRLDGCVDGCEKTFDMLSPDLNNITKQKYDIQRFDCYNMCN